jgi:hypothetical protein
MDEVTILKNKAKEYLDNTDEKTIKMLCANFLNTLIIQIIIKTGQIFFTGLMFFLAGCNSNTNYKEEVLNNIPTYENSAKEIINSFGTVARLQQWQDTTFHSAELYSRQINSIENIVERKDLLLSNTKALISKSLTKYIFLNSDTSVYYNTYNSELSITKSYRHFLCFTPHHSTIRFDMINHAYKILKTKSIGEDWNYVILEVGSD